MTPLSTPTQGRERRAQANRMAEILSGPVARTLVGEIIVVEPLKYIAPPAALEKCTVCRRGLTWCRAAASEGARTNDPPHPPIPGQAPLTAHHRGSGIELRHHGLSHQEGCCKGWMGQAEGRGVSECSTCGKAITPQSKSGMCRSCVQVRNAAARTPEQIEEARARGRKSVLLLQTPEIMAKSHSPEVRRAATERRRQTMMGWCPDEFLPLYRELRDRKGIHAHEARAVIEPMIFGSAAHAKRTVANNIDAGRIRHERQKAQAY